METSSKSNDLLTRLRSVTLEDELKLADFWPTETSKSETSFGSSFKTDSLSSYKPSWESTDLNRRSTSFHDSEQEPDYLPKPSDQTLSAEKQAGGNFLGTSDSVKNQENPFAKISRKRSNLTSKLSQNLRCWMKSTSYFGIMGAICGGSLVAWSLLAKSGSHSVTALGLSLTISGVLMLILVGICQTVIHTSGQT